MRASADDEQSSGEAWRSSPRSHPRSRTHARTAVQRATWSRSQPAGSQPRKNAALVASEMAITSANASAMVRARLLTSGAVASTAATEAYTPYALVPRQWSVHSSGGVTKRALTSFILSTSAAALAGVHSAATVAAAVTLIIAPRALSTMHGSSSGRSSRLASRCHADAGLFLLPPSSSTSSSSRLAHLSRSAQRNRAVGSTISAAAAKVAESSDESIAAIKAQSPASATGKGVRYRITHGARSAGCVAHASSAASPSASTDQSRTCAPTAPSSAHAQPTSRWPAPARSPMRRASDAERAARTRCANTCCGSGPSKQSTARSIHSLKPPTESLEDSRPRQNTGCGGQSSPPAEPPPNRGQTDGLVAATGMTSASAMTTTTTCTTSVAVTAVIPPTSVYTSAALADTSTANVASMSRRTDTPALMLMRMADAQMTIDTTSGTANAAPLAGPSRS
mmetsp:Transcript_20955/g.54026  ORF Transcript_20955/g.54026 Transcript_20955/m.54026 type:complete len:453 (+) Transcript_20955:1630-2988(+)